MRIEGEPDTTELRNVDAGSVIEHEGNIFIVMDTDTGGIKRNLEHFVSVCKLDNGRYDTIHEANEVKVWDNAVLMLKGANKHHAK